MKTTTLWIAAASVLVAAADPTPAQQDAQARAEPQSAPGAGQEFLGQFVGDWDVEKAFYPRSGEPVRQRGRCRQTLIHGGRFLQSEFTFEAPGGETTGLGLIGFEPETGQFTSVWADSRQTAMSMRRSREPFDGRTKVLESRSLDGAGAAARRSRTETRLEDDGRRIVHRQYALGPGDAERLIMELVLTRR
jgi:hypothetical protein